jgi:hypothetical protein
MDTIPEIMLDITKTRAFLHTIQKIFIVMENKHNRIIGASYTLNVQQGINNQHQALMA